MFRFWGLAWTPKTLHLRSCFSLTSKDLFLMLERDCNAFVQNTESSCQRLITYSCHGFAQKLPVDFQVNAWGPSDFKYLVDAMKSFIPNAAMVHTHSFGDVPRLNGAANHDARKMVDPIVLVDDEVVKISAILLHPVSASESSQNQNPDAALKPGDVSVIYVCELPEIKGKFDPRKAGALGLRPGPKYRQLQLGNSVKSDKQDIMVHPSDVLGPSIPGPVVLLVDCPTPLHMHQLFSIQSLNKYYADSSNKEENSKFVNCVIHLSPALVAQTSDYQMWMSRFGEAQHIMAGHEMKNIEIPILGASARISARLNYLCPQLFPAPGYWSIQDLMGTNLDSKASCESCIPKNFESISAENLMKFILRPYTQLGLDRSGIPTTVAPAEIISGLLSEIPETAEAAQQIAQFWSGAKETRGQMVSQDNKLMIEEPWLVEDAIPSCLEGMTREEMEIVLLGTGSSQPSKYRNVSSVYVNLFSKGSLLLDCGEGTLGQLKRRFGVKGADDAVRNLKFIWISHIHADHHTGLARILALRRDLLNGIPHEPIIVIGPRQLKRFLDAYGRLEDLDMQFLDCEHTTEASLQALELNNTHPSPEKPSDFESQPADTTLFSKGSRMQSYWKRPGIPADNKVALLLLKKLKRVLREAGLEVLISFPVIHCPQAFGIALRAADRLNDDGKSVPGWKIVYSGDTRPCPELIKASLGATVLIHEATFEDGMVEEAIARNHSTTSEAIEAGNSAGAYRIILTHFSQRYPKIPVVDENHMHKTCIAFDMMSVNLADLPVLPKILPYLKLLFKNEMVVDELDDNSTAVTAIAN
ncbi:hypothetical protein AgCh_016251 [Apium graveolens]